MNLRPFLLVAAFGVAACRDQAPSPRVADPTSTVPRGAIQVVVQQEAATTPGTLTFVVRVVANGPKMGAYQGAVTFTPGAFELVTIGTPKPADGEFYIVNPASFAQGRIKFAAYATKDFSGTEAFRMVVKPLKPLGEAALAGALELAGEETGSRVAAAKLKASNGIHDAATNELIVP